MAFTSRNITHRPGIWGPVTATLDWCEENYQFSPYVAEMANTMSNLVTIAFAFYGAYRAVEQNLPKRFIMTFVLLGIVGLGSVAFHGTLLYSAQLADELPMIYIASGSIFILLDMGKGFPSPMPMRTKLLAGSILAFDVLFSAAYILYRNPVFHQVVFATLMLGITARTESIVNRTHKELLQPSEIKTLRRILLLGTATFSFGFLIWNLDNVFCDNITVWKHRIKWPWAFLLEGHSWWHYLTGAGGYLLLLGTGYLALLVKDTSNSYTLSYKLGVPYITRHPGGKRID